MLFYNMTKSGANYNNSTLSAISHSRLLQVFFCIVKPDLIANSHSKI